MTVLVALLTLFGCRETMSSSGDPRQATRAWNRLLGEVVQPDGRVDYDRLEEDRTALDDYVAWIAQGDAMRGKKKADRHAFWLNAFNALVLFQVLERGRPASVVDVPGWWPGAGSGFFVETQFPVGPEHLSLAEILHERIRMKELNYRDHAAVSLASMGGPPMRGELYEKPHLKDQLIDQTERWLRDPEQGVAVVDSVAWFPAQFGWYPRDFEFTSGGLDPCAVAARHVEAPLSEELSRLSERGCPHRFRDFDWRLDDAVAAASYAPGDP